MSINVETVIFCSCTCNDWSRGSKRHKMSYLWMVIFKLVAYINTSTSAREILTWNANDSLHANTISFTSATQKMNMLEDFPAHFLMLVLLIFFSLCLPFYACTYNNPGLYKPRKIFAQLDVHKSLRIGCCKYCTVQDIYKNFLCSLFFVALWKHKNWLV